jgi:hypothetical protein
MARFILMPKSMSGDACATLWTTTSSDGATDFECSDWSADLAAKGSTFVSVGRG